MMISATTGMEIAVSIRVMMTEAVVIITSTSVMVVPRVADVMFIAITNAQAMKDMEDILIVRVLRLAMENARFGRSVLTMVPVVLVVSATITTVQTQTAVRTIRKNMNRSVGVAIFLVEIITVTIATTIGKELFQRLPCW